jgi:hypothetical protein
MFYTRAAAQSSAKSTYLSLWGAGGHNGIKAPKYAAGKERFTYE